MLQVETRIGTTHLVVRTLPSVCVRELKKTKEKNLFFCEALVDALIAGIN